MTTSKKDNSLATLPETRTAPIPVSKRQSNRIDTVMIGGHFPQEVSYLLLETCVKLSRKRKGKVTVQKALEESLRDFFKKHGMEIPASLKD